MAARRKALISAFVLAWLALFNYESLRANYLSRWLGVELPKFRLLFPPAGWIMFYSVEDSEGFAEVYGRKGEQAELIDPHSVFETRWVGYDNIHRNVMITALNPAYAPAFCAYLKRKFPAYEGFLIMEAWHPSVTKAPKRVIRQLAYRC